jgi:GNAT superfamily N-acetyltransferase
LHAFKDLWNQAWKANHGFVPLTKEEIEFIAEDLKSIADYNLILFAKIGEKLVGGTIVLRDFNYITKKMNGRLFPFNFIKFFTLKKKIKWIRIVILGVLPEYQRRGIDAVLYNEIIKRASALGCEWAEASFILESNVMMNRALESIGGEVYKKYRVLEMRI